MRMGKRLGSFLAAGGAAALAVALSAAPAGAVAAAGWTISPGGSFAGAQSGKVTIADTVTKVSVVCATTAAAGSFKSGTGLPGAGIGSLGSLSLTGCATANGLRFTVTAGALPWSLNAGKYIPAKATSYGTLTGMHLTLAAAGCSAAIDGTSAAGESRRRRSSARRQSEPGPAHRRPHPAVRIAGPEVPRAAYDERACVRQQRLHRGVPQRRRGDREQRIPAVPGGDHYLALIPGRAGSARQQPDPGLIRGQHPAIAAPQGTSW